MSNPIRNGKPKPRLQSRQDPTNARKDEPAKSKPAPPPPAPDEEDEEVEEDEDEPRPSRRPKFVPALPLDDDDEDEDDEPRPYRRPEPPPLPLPKPRRRMSINDDDFSESGFRRGGTFDISLMFRSQRHNPLGLAPHLLLPATASAAQISVLQYFIYISSPGIDGKGKLFLKCTYGGYKWYRTTYTQLARKLGFSDPGRAPADLRGRETSRPEGKGHHLMRRVLQGLVKLGVLIEHANVELDNEWTEPEDDFRGATHYRGKLYRLNTQYISKIVHQIEVEQRKDAARYAGQRIEDTPTYLYVEGRQARKEREKQEELDREEADRIRRGKW
jgi:hypothetical protein